MYLKQPCYAYSACGQFTKKQRQIEKNINTGNTHFIYRNDLHKACFRHDMAYSKSKYSAKRTQSDNFMRSSIWNCK